jgi:hypothetical protein
VQVGNDDPRYDLAPGPDCTSPARRLDRVPVLMAGGESERVVFDREPNGTAATTSRSPTCSGLTMTRLRCARRCEGFCD